MPLTKKKKPQRKQLSNILSRFSRKRIVPAVSNRENEYRNRAIIKENPKMKTKSHSPQDTSAKLLTTIGQYDTFDSNSIVPLASEVNLQYNSNDYLPEASRYITDAEYPPKQKTFLDKMLEKMRRPKTHPQQLQSYNLVSKHAGKYTRKTRSKRSRQ
jgi:hypothetical protein